MPLNEKFLAQSELDSLLIGVTDKHNKKTLNNTKKIDSYSFISEQYSESQHFPAIELINERFSKLFKSELFNLLCKPVEITSGYLKTEIHGDFTQNILLPANIYLIEINPLPGNALITIDYKLIFLLVDHLFGGTGSLPKLTANHECSQIEQRIANRIIKIIFDCLKKAWEDIYKIDINLLRVETNPKFATITQPSDLVLSTTFKVEIGNLSGNINFCLPTELISPIQELLQNKANKQTPTPNTNWELMLKREVQSADVELTANLTSIDLTLRDIQNMKVNDIIPIEMPEIISATINNIPIIECSYGKLNGQYALRVEKLINAPHHDSQEI